MMKRKSMKFTEAWWVWVGDEPAVRVGSELEAMKLLLEEGKEYGIGNSFNRCDMASPILEVLWNKHLPEGATYHNAILAPFFVILHRGVPRKVIKPLTPSRLAQISRSWYALVPELPAWWPKQYDAAINDNAALKVRGKKKPLEDQLDARWPESICN